MKRQHALFEHAILKAGRPEILVEERERGKPRAIVCWPVPHRHGGPEAAGALCFLVPRAIDLKAAERRLKPWLPLAAMLLAVSEPRLTLQRAKVDWRVLTNVTLHRLHQRLKPYLVLVHVDPGAVEADALLLADAIAHAIEDAIDRAPPGSQVRVSVRRAAGGWAFQVEATAPADAAPRPPRPGLVVAKQVVAAHGGAWRAEAKDGVYRVGFMLPEGQAS